MFQKAPVPGPVGVKEAHLMALAQGLQCLSSLRVCIFAIKEIWEAACRAVLWEPFTTAVCLLP